jgi:hypothetical protein
MLHWNEPHPANFLMSIPTTMSCFCVDKLVERCDWYANQKEMFMGKMRTVGDFHLVKKVSTIFLNPDGYATARPRCHQLLNQGTVGLHKPVMHITHDHRLITRGSTSIMYFQIPVGPVFLRLPMPRSHSAGNIPNCYDLETIGISYTKTSLLLK